MSAQSDPSRLTLEEIERRLQQTRERFRQLQEEHDRLLAEIEERRRRSSEVE